MREEEVAKLRPSRAQEGDVRRPALGERGQRLVAVGKPSLRSDALGRLAPAGAVPDDLADGFVGAVIIRVGPLPGASRGQELLEGNLGGDEMLGALADRPPAGGRASW